MRYFTLPGGGLRIVASNPARADLADAFRAGGYYRAESEVAEAITGNGLDFVAPEHIGALTDAPIIADGFGFEDDGTPSLADDARVWWFPDYAVRDPWAELRDTGRVDFTLAA